MILDIIVVILIILGALIGYKKGLVGIAVSLVSIILSIVLGFILQGTIANALYNDTGVGSVIEQSVRNNIESSKKEEENNIYDNIINTISGHNSKEYTTDQASKAITMFILKGLSFVLIFIVVFIICYILQMILNFMFNLPILSSVNKIGGIAAGAIKVLIKLYIILALISFMEPMSLIEPVISLINGSFITKLLYSNNWLVSLICATLKI